LLQQQPQLRQGLFSPRWIWSEHGRS
jgi:hypothetical protein